MVKKAETVTDFIFLGSKITVEGDCSHEFKWQLFLGRKAMTNLDSIYFFNFYFYFILLYNTVLCLPYIDMNPPRVYMSSQTWTPLPPPTPYHLSGSSPCTSPKHPVFCIEHRLAIRFLHDRIHVSMPFSKTIPPSPSPSESKSPLYTSVSLLLSRKGGQWVVSF